MTARVAGTYMYTIPGSGGCGRNKCSEVTGKASEGLRLFSETTLL